MRPPDPVVVNAPRARSKSGRRRWLRAALRTAFMIAIGFATLANLEFGASNAEGALRNALDPALTPRAVVDFVRNIVLFAGWGMVWAATAPAHARRIVAGAVISGALLSGAAESIQLFTTGRQPSVLDILSNTSGAWFGALLFVLSVRLTRNTRRARSFVGVPAFLFAAPWAVLVLLNAFTATGRQERLPIWGAPWERLSVALAHVEVVSAVPVSLLDLLLFAAAGMLATAAFVEVGRSYRRAALVVTLIGMAAAPAVELARGLAGYSIAAAPPIANAAGIAAGAWATALALPKFTARVRGVRRPRILLIVLAATTWLWSWRPFRIDPEIATKTSSLNLVPLAAYLDRVDLFTVADVLISFLLFVPIGALLAVWPLRGDGWLSTFLPGLYMAVILEVGQVAIADRWFDITDMLVQAAAVVLGWAIVRRAGFRPHGALLHSRGTAT